MDSRQEVVKVVLVGDNGVGKTRWETSRIFHIRLRINVE